MAEIVGGHGFSGKEKITEILNRRHKEREIQIQAAKLEREKDADETEAMQFFESSFDEKVKLIGNSLATVGKSEQKAQVFAEVQNEIHDLQRYLSTSTFFLNEYKIKAELIPKKKFGFKSKKIVKTSAEKFTLDKLDGAKDASADEDRMKWTFTNRKNELIELPREKIDDQTITGSNLTNCVIRLEGHSGSLQFSKLDNCLVICGPTARSIFLDDCHNCKFVVACQQLRCHRSRNCDLYLKVTSRAIIEDCAQIQVAEYNGTYPELDGDLLKSGLDPTVNNWNILDDFNWLSTDKPSPNWSILEHEQLILNWPAYQDQFQQTHSLCNTFE
ncbi:hypothetical protein pipiens_008890 [Culex pipiens pipiens]|uniref:C-CAP/cofactor C-like domain-containing protein n=1 Tax=Culex pipiens pipiens TaxID=38569 RepID=A0ABD1DFX9_CULPP